MMESPPKEMLTFYISLNQRLLDMQVNGISHAESLVQPPFNGNCLNWVLGHILTDRDSMFKELGLPGELTSQQYQRYDRGSDPITSPQDAIHLDDLRAMSTRSAERLKTRNNSMDMTALKLASSGHHNRAMGAVLAFAIWHESYHVGQLELLRQISGKNDKII